MDYYEITVPDMNDSISRITLDEQMFYIRFTYNDTDDYWSFGLYEDPDVPIAIGIKIVPGIVLNLFFGLRQLPNGAFGCKSQLDRVGRNDFVDGLAKFIYIPAGTVV